MGVPIGAGGRTTLGARLIDVVVCCVRPLLRVHCCACSARRTNKMLARPNFLKTNSNSSLPARTLTVSCSSATSLSPDTGYSNTG